MPLPFMKFRKSAGISMAVRAPEGSESQPEEQEAPESYEDQGLITVSDELLTAVTNADPQAIAQALRAAFEILNAEPHIEDEQQPQTPFNDE